jgi:hypothetical protein
VLLSSVCNLLADQVYEVLCGQALDYVADLNHFGDSQGYIEVGSMVMLVRYRPTWQIFFHFSSSDKSDRRGSTLLYSLLRY